MNKINTIWPKYVSLDKNGKFPSSVVLKFGRTFLIKGKNFAIYFCPEEFGGWSCCINSNLIISSKNSYWTSHLDGTQVYKINKKASFERNGKYYKFSKDKR